MTKLQKSHLKQMHDSKGVVLSQKSIDARCSKVADRLIELYRDVPFTLVGVLNGAVVFVTDLLRHLSNIERYDQPIELEFVRARSYVGTNSGEIGLNLKILDRKAIEGRHVVLVDDILDTGKTLHHLVREIREMKPASIRPVVLLRKNGMQSDEYPVEIDPDDIGFQIEPKFVVGRGLDYNGLYRNLTWIAEYVGPRGEPG